MKKLFSLLIFTLIVASVALTLGSCNEEHVHTAGAPVVENEVAATCTKAGSYDDVTYCTECNQELTRVKNITAIIDHEGAAPVIENEQEGSCTQNEQHDSVVYCSGCDLELSRKTVVTKAAKGHESAGEVTEKIEATCTTHGHTDEVEYCKNCKVELNRREISYDHTPLGHTPEDAVVENYVMNSCTKDGGYYQVVYCSVCTDDKGKKTEIDRWYTVIPMRAHTASTEAKKENIVPATCLAPSSYDLVTYCAECNKHVMSKTTVVADDKLVHSGTYEVIENYVNFTCHKDGSYESVHYCKDCGLEHSRIKVILEAHHVKAEAVKTDVVDATPEKDGSYDLVVYCIHCKEELSRETVIVPYGKKD